MSPAERFAAVRFLFGCALGIAPMTDNTAVRVAAGLAQFEDLAGHLRALFPNRIDALVAGQAARCAGIRVRLLSAGRVEEKRQPRPGRKR
jgi:hypothetical protein